MTKYARMSKSARDVEPYKCQYDWPEDCFCQGGEDGMVFPKGSFEEALSIIDTDKTIELLAGKTPHYKTAFFEAFPRKPDTFLRGEGKTMQEAEDKAWAQFIKYNQCAKHYWEPRGYTNGGGFCKFCNLFQSNLFPLKPSSKSELAIILKSYESLAMANATDHQFFPEVNEKILELRIKHETAQEIVEWTEPEGYWDGAK